MRENLNSKIVNIYNNAPVTYTTDIATKKKKSFYVIVILRFKYSFLYRTFINRISSLKTFLKTIIFKFLKIGYVFKYTYMPMHRYCHKKQKFCTE